MNSYLLNGELESCAQSHVAILVGKGQFNIGGDSTEGRVDFSGSADFIFSSSGEWAASNDGFATIEEIFWDFVGDFDDANPNSQANFQFSRVVSSGKSTSHHQSRAIGNGARSIASLCFNPIRQNATIIAYNSNTG